MGCCGSQGAAPAAGGAPAKPAGAGGKVTNTALLIDPKKSVTVHVGPLSVGKDGAVAKPKLNFGIEGLGLYGVLGFKDIRDGVQAEAYAEAVKEYASKGKTLTEFLQNCQAVAKTPVIDDIITAVPAICAEVTEKLSLPGNFGKDVLSVEGVLSVYVGAGVGAGAFFGWADTAGYRMIGVRGEVAAASGVGMYVKAGLHATRKNKIRFVCWMTNVGIDVVATIRGAARDAK